MSIWLLDCAWSFFNKWIMTSMFLRRLRWSQPPTIRSIEPSSAGGSGPLSYLLFSFPLHCQPHADGIQQPAGQHRIVAMLHAAPPPDLPVHLVGRADLRLNIDDRRLSSATARPPLPPRWERRPPPLPQRPPPRCIRWIAALRCTDGEASKEGWWCYIGRPALLPSCGGGATKDH
jgi:hypothetical protein